MTPSVDGNTALVCNQSELHPIGRRKWSRGADVLQRSTANSAIDRRPQWRRAAHHAIDLVMKFRRSSAFTVAVASIQQHDTGRQIGIYMKWETLDDFRFSCSGWPTLTSPIDSIRKKNSGSTRSNRGASAHIMCTFLSVYIPRAGA